MTKLFIDPIGGIAGDMLCAALLDLGLDQKTWRLHLSSLGLDNYHMNISSCIRGSFSATHLSIAPKEEHPTPDSHDQHHHHHAASWGHHHRNLKDILKIIEDSSIPDRSKDYAQKVFYTLGKAEAMIHGCSIEEIHFHEVGATDSILDIVGFCVGVVLLDISEIYFAPPPLSFGHTHGAHGNIPLPAPATLSMLKGFHVRSGYPGHEQTTPTGAAIISALGIESQFPTGRISDIGYGAGTRNPKDYPNVLRVFTMESPQGDLYELQTQIDDMTGESLPLLIERSIAHGALDAFAQSITMKKGRIGFLFTALVRSTEREKIENIIFQNTSTFGIRRHRVDRSILQRTLVPVETPWGIVHMKLGYLHDTLVQKSVEYEDAARVARQYDLPLSTIYTETQKIWRESL